MKLKMKVMIRNDEISSILNIEKQNRLILRLSKHFFKRFSCVRTIYSYSYSDQSSSRPRGPKPSGLPEETSYVKYSSPFCSGSTVRTLLPPSSSVVRTSLGSYNRSHRSSTGGLAYSFCERVMGVGNELPYRLGLYTPASDAFGQHKYRG